MAALSQHGLALQFTSVALKGNFHMVMQAVSQRGEALLTQGMTFGSKSLNNVHTRCIVKDKRFYRGAFVKIGDFIKFQGFHVEFLENQAILRKSKTPRKSPEKWTFLSLAFYNAPSLHTVKSHFSGYFVGLLWGDPESHFLVTFALLGILGVSGLRGGPHFHKTSFATPSAAGAEGWGLEIPH